MASKYPCDLVTLWTLIKGCVWQEILWVNA